MVQVRSTGLVGRRTCTGEERRDVDRTRDPGGVDRTAGLGAAAAWRARLSGAQPAQFARTRANTAPDRRRLMRRLSGAIGVLVAATSVAAGLPVLMGLDLPGYVVLPWLVRYNVMAGMFGVVAGIAVWRAMGDRHCGRSGHRPPDGAHRAGRDADRGQRRGQRQPRGDGPAGRHLDGRRACRAAREPHARRQVVVWDVSGRVDHGPAHVFLWLDGMDPA
jgi:hypothetical protein